MGNRHSTHGWLLNDYAQCSRGIESSLSTKDFFFLSIVFCTGVRVSYDSPRCTQEEDLVRVVYHGRLGVKIVSSVRIFSTSDIFLRAEISS